MSQFAELIREWRSEAKRHEHEAKRAQFRSCEAALFEMAAAKLHRCADELESVMRRSGT